MRRLLVCCLIMSAACKQYDPLFCDENKPCPVGSDRPFCDLRGEYPDSFGVARTCIPFPTDASPGVVPDAAVADSGSAAVDAGQERFVVDVAIGHRASCAILNDGGLRCWGHNFHGRFGYPLAMEVIGDNDHPFEAGDIPTGGAVKQVAIGLSSMCLLYEEGNVRCVGNNTRGALGYGHTMPVGWPSEASDVPLGDAAVQIAAGAAHMCAILASGAVRCWGEGRATLGYGDGEQVVGDDETPADKPVLDIGSAVIRITLGTSHTCAVLAGGDGRIRCWGINATNGLLGLGYTTNIGDDESPSAAGDVPIGGPVEVVKVFDNSSCAILTSGVSRCWGAGSSVLGYENQENFGDGEPASAAPALALGGRPRDLGGGSKCAIMSDDSLRCWGRNAFGELGYGRTNPVGQDGNIVAAGTVQLRSGVDRLADGTPAFLGGPEHNCALLTNREVRCWGLNSYGQLGLGHVESIGDDEQPIDVPAVRVLE